MKKIIFVLVAFILFSTGGAFGVTLPDKQQAVDEVSVKVEIDSVIAIVVCDSVTIISIRKDVLSASKVERVQKFITSNLPKLKLDMNNLYIKGIPLYHNSYELITYKAHLFSYFLETEGNRVQNRVSKS